MFNLIFGADAVKNTLITIVVWPMLFSLILAEITLE